MDIFVARQPIFNTQKQVVAYELLFRNGVKNLFDANTDSNQATHNVVANSIASIGLNALIGNKRAFVNFTADNLLSGLAKLVPPQSIVIEILETVEPTPEIIAACTELRDAGYQLVLDDFVFHARFRPLIELAEVIKIDFLAVNSAESRKKIRSILPPHIKLLAEKVETYEDYQQGIEFGYELFQGYFFSRPDIIQRKDISTARLSQFRLLKLVNSKTFEVDQIETIIKQDVALSYKLMRYINSVGFGLTNKIKSVRQAILLLGPVEFRKWVFILSLGEMPLEKPSELRTNAIIRARMCEMIAAFTAPEQSALAFLVGSFSLLEAFLDRPLAEVLPELNLPSELSVALTSNHPVHTPILELVKAYEQADWQTIHQYATRLKFAESRLPDVYQEAIQWVNKVMDL